jgi:RimJ/RimL family protein N-acetyltransferase
MNVPTLESERLTFRGHRLDDLGECAAMWGDPQVTRHIGGVPFALEEVWARLLRYVGHWELLGFGYWVIREKASGRFVGEVGFADFKRPLDPPLGAPEMGWALASWSHGRGKSNLRASRTACIIDPGNLASIHVAEKCGFKETSRTSYKGKPVFLFDAAF